VAHSCEIGCWAEKTTLLDRLVCCRLVAFKPLKMAWTYIWAGVSNRRKIEFRMTGPRNGRPARPVAEGRPANAGSIFGALRERIRERGEEVNESCLRCRDTTGQRGSLVIHIHGHP
jgi:hypothetical protein